jgi:GTPase SAR1 family protein
LLTTDSRKTITTISKEIEHIRSIIGDSVTIALVGNKTDLRPMVSTEEGKQMAALNQIPLFFEISVKHHKEQVENVIRKCAEASIHVHKKGYRYEELHRLFSSSNLQVSYFRERLRLNKHKKVVDCIIKTRR